MVDEALSGGVGHNEHTWLNQLLKAFRNPRRLSPRRLGRIEQLAPSLRLRISWVLDLDPRVPAAHAAHRPLLWRHSTFSTVHEAHEPMIDVGENFTRTGAAPATCCRKARRTRQDRTDPDPHRGSR